MDIDALTAQLPSLREEAQRYREHEAEAARKAENLESIIQGIEGLHSPATVTKGHDSQAVAPTTDADLPRGIGAVRRVVLEHPGRIWKAKEIHAVLEARGWISPGAGHPLRGTEAAINRLWKRGELDRVATGRYRATEAIEGADD